MKTPYLHKNVPAIPAGPNLSQCNEFYVGGVVASGPRSQAVRIAADAGWTVTIRRERVPELIAALQRYLTWADTARGT